MQHKYEPQNLFARIRKSSKYFGQTPPGELFEVCIVGGGEYLVQGGPGGQYRLADVDLFVLDAAEGVVLVQVTAKGAVPTALLPAQGASK